MAIGSGLASQIMVKAETTYGTPVTVDRPVEFIKESIKADVEKVDAYGLGRGRVLPSARTKTVKRGYGGDIEMFVLSKGFGLWLQHWLGQNTVTGSSADKTHTCVLDALAQQGKAMTVQVGRPDSGGTVRAHTYEGGKILKGELSASVGESLKFLATMDFENELTNTALATPSWPTGTEHFIYTEAAITLAGSPFYIGGFKLGVDAHLAADRRFMGGAKKEPIATAVTDIMGSFDGQEYTDLTNYNNTLAGTTGAVVITFTGPTNIPTASNPPSLTITLPVVEFLEASPNVEGPDIIKFPLPYRVTSNLTDAPITVVYVTADTAA